MVLLQLADAALLRLHPAVCGRRRGRLLALRGRGDRTRATLARRFRLPSRRRYTYLHRRRTPKTILLSRTPRRCEHRIRTTLRTLIRRRNRCVGRVLQRPIRIVFLLYPGQRGLLTDRTRRAYYWLRGDCKQATRTISKYLSVTGRHFQYRLPLYTLTSFCKRHF